MSVLKRASFYIRVFFVLGLTVLVVPGLPKAHSASSQEARSTERARATHLLQRATYGPLAESIDAVVSSGIDDWLDRQLHPERIDDSELGRLLTAAPAPSMSLPELLRQYPPGQVLQPVRELVQGDSLPPAERRALRRELGEHSPRRILGDLTTARLTKAVYSERQLEEMMTAFWFDHFNVFWGKGATRSLVPDYEENAIRPHVFGKFEDMVLETAQHPAMLFYLDNFQSVAPDSSREAGERREALSERMRRMSPRDRERVTQRVAQRRTGPKSEQQRRRQPGMNENYARELMELHTLGVDGGYTQEDVVDVARILTGWSFGGTGNRTEVRQARTSYEGGRLVLPEVDYAEAYRFRFRSALHDAGEKTVLGHNFVAGGGQEEGVELIRMLSRHPSTARHIATQLATRFVADEPPEALVDHLAEVFLATSGDLREVTRALFTSDAFYEPDLAANRVKSPFLLVASTLRMTHARIDDGQALMEPLRSLGEAPYFAEPPTGYPETSAQWASSGAMLTRMNFATSYVMGDLNGVAPDGDRLWADIPGPMAVPSLTKLAAVLLPETDTSELIAIIRDDLQANPPERPREGAVRALSLILGSPEFQRH